MTTIAMKELIDEYNLRATIAGLPKLKEKELSDSLAKLRQRIKELPEPSIAQFTRVHGIDPRRGRALLRRRGFSAPYSSSNNTLRGIVLTLAEKQGVQNVQKA